MRTFFRRTRPRARPPRDRPGRATLAVVDVAADALGAVETCGRLYAEYPSLPLVALLCCEYAVTPGRCEGCSPPA